MIGTGTLRAAHAGLNDETIALAIVATKE